MNKHDEYKSQLQGAQDKAIFILASAIENFITIGMHEEARTMAREIISLISKPDREGGDS